MKTKNADRAADNLLRIVENNHFRLSDMADNKAHLMVVVCSLMLSLLVPRFYDPLVRHPVIIMSIACVISILCALYSAMPTYHRRQIGKPRIKNPNFNILFFGNFTQLSYEEFEKEMEQVINDRDLVYESLIRDLYGLGEVLNDKKYRFVRLSYLFFMGGLLASGIALALSW
jgi:hypothetical protein